MRQTITRTLVVLSLLGAGLAGARPCLADPGPRDLLEQARMALREADYKLASTEEGVVTEAAAVERLEAAFRTGEDPIRVARELRLVGQRVDLLGREVVALVQDLRSIREMLDKVMDEARRRGDLLLMRAAQRELAFLAGLEERVVVCKRDIKTLREAINQLMEKVRGALVAAVN